MMKINLKNNTVCSGKSVFFFNILSKICRPICINIGNIEIFSTVNHKKTIFIIIIMCRRKMSRVSFEKYFRMIYIICSAGCNKFWIFDALETRDVSRYRRHATRIIKNY